MASPLEATARRHAIVAALRTSSAWSVLVALFIGLWPESIIGRVVVVCVVAGLPLLACVMLPLERIGDRLAHHIRPAETTTRFHNVTSEIAVALNEPVEMIVAHASDIANVGMLPTTRGEVVLATTESFERLKRYELQALVAAQFAGMRDRWCRLATRAEYLWHALPFSMLLVPASLLLGRPVYFMAAFLSIFVVVFVPRWNEHARDLCADVAAVRTTFDPQSLADAMRKLSEQADRADQIDLGSFFLPMSPFLVLPKRVKSTTTTNVGGERAWSSADEVRLELALRADRALAMAAGASPEQLTGREFGRRWGELGRPDADEQGP